MIVDLIGFLAAALTTAAYIPQIARIIKTRSVEDVSLNMYIVMLTGVIFWLIYGIYINSLPVIAANTVTACFVGSILIFKIIYK